MIVEPLLLLLELIIDGFAAVFLAVLMVQVDGSAGRAASVLRIVPDEDHPARLLAIRLLLGCLHDRIVVGIGRMACLSASFAFLECPGGSDRDARGLAHAFLSVHELLLLRDLLYVGRHAKNSKLGQLSRA